MTGAHDRYRKISRLKMRRMCAPKNAEKLESTDHIRREYCEKASKAYPSGANIVLGSGSSIWLFNVWKTV